MQVKFLWLNICQIFRLWMTILNMMDGALTVSQSVRSSLKEGWTPYLEAAFHHFSFKHQIRAMYFPFFLKNLINVWWGKIHIWKHNY